MRLNNDKGLRFLKEQAEKTVCSIEDFWKDNDLTNIRAAHIYAMTVLKLLSIVEPEDTHFGEGDEGDSMFPDNVDEYTEYAVTYMKITGPDRVFVQARTDTEAAVQFFDRHPKVDDIMVAESSPNCVVCTNRCDEACGAVHFTREEVLMEPPF